MAYRRVILLCVMLAGGMGIAAAPGPLQSPSKSSTPSVTLAADGRRQIRFTPEQEQAIEVFVRRHPDMKRADYFSLSLSPTAAQNSYTEWKNAVESARAKVQFPFAAWGDFNGDGLLDIVVPFFSTRTVNNWGWREWWLVVFQGQKNGAFVPVIAARDTWGLCFDGMFYHPSRRRIEFWCGSGGGYFWWDGSKYVSKKLVGD